MTRLAMDAPVVMAQRASRLGDPSTLFSAANQREFSRMVMEKQAAAAESGLAMWASATAMYQSMWLDMVLGKSAFPPGPTASRTAGAANAALRPYQKRASANARRLGKRAR